MKNIIQRTWIFFLISTLHFSCKQQEDIIPGKGNATFSMSSVGRNKSGGRLEQNENSVAVLLSIEDSNGELVAENKKLSLFAFGNGFVSESLELTEGDYKLVQFQILNADDVIIYASPMVGSVLAKYVTNPLPINFSINKDSSTQVIPQVLAVLPADTPESFGYVNFGFELVDISSSTPKLVELWQDEPWDIHYKHFYVSYSGEVLVKQTSFYFWNNEWKLMDSTNFQYYTDGKLREKNSYYVFDLQPGQQPTASKTLFEYYDDGKLKNLIGLGYNGTNDHIFEFFYDANGKPAYANQKFYPSLVMRYQIKYELNDDGDIINTKYYNASGTTLMFEYNYTYDQTISPLPFHYEYDPHRVMQKHNVTSQKTIGYNMISGVLTESYSCQFSVSYDITNSLVTHATVLNPDGCFETNQDQTQHTYIYK